MRLRLVVLSVLFLSGCEESRRRGGDGDITRCGDGVVEGREICDGIDLGGRTCEGEGFGPGTLACAPGCRGVELAMCGAPAGCGDGVIAAPEVCDGTNLAGRTCESFGFNGGALTCYANCGGFTTIGCGPPIMDAGIPANMDATTTPPDGSADPCSGVTCSGHGQCAVAAGNAICVCESGYHPDGLNCVEDVNNAPSITSFTASRTSISEGDSIRFHVVVSDPDGLQDILGGGLMSPNNVRYGSFAGIGPGEYELTLTWSEIDALVPFAFTGSEMRTFLADFYDAGGNHGMSPIQIRAHCDSVGASAAICDGSCADIASVERCGSCNLGCTFLQEAGFFDITCAPGNSCVYRGYPETSCTSACARDGGSCTSAVITLFLEYPNTRAVSCDYVAGTHTPTPVTLNLLNCNCYDGMSFTEYPKVSNQTCRDNCMQRGLTCSSVHFRGTIVSSGNTAEGGDQCAPPYDVVSTYEGVSVGQTINIDEVDIAYDCRCSAAAR